MLDILTELEEFEAERVDGVENPANGFPILLMKAIDGEAAKTAGCGCCANCEATPATTTTDPLGGGAGQPRTEGARRTTELGAANPPASDGARKDVDETSAAPEPQAGQVSSDDLTKAAVTEALKPLQDELAAVKAEMAKVKAMEIPGGPLTTAPASVRAARLRDDELAKAAHYARLAEEITEPDLRNYYQRLAETARAAARG